MKPLPTTRAAQLAPAPYTAQDWLIEGLWSAQAVGIIGGEPKCGKSFLALDLAVAVASGAPCLRHFPTCQCGRVLLFAAEDATYLRALQRSYQTAVALVHHARKGAAHERGGQALRGSSELHAWGDSNLYLRRHGQNLLLSIEHRAAPGADRLPITLKVRPQRSPWRSSINNQLLLQPLNRPACNGSNRPSPARTSPSHKRRSAISCACAPAMSVRLLPRSLQTAA
jgi:AAA domain